MATKTTKRRRPELSPQLEEVLHYYLYQLWDDSRPWDIGKALLEAWFLGREFRVEPAVWRRRWKRRDDEGLYYLQDFQDTRTGENALDLVNAEAGYALDPLNAEGGNA